jgi:hypothetical protein
VSRFAGISLILAYGTYAMRIVFIACLTVAFLRPAFADQSPRVSGPYATRLLFADIEQIKIASNPRHEPLTKIEAFRPDSVHVHTGNEATWTLVTHSKRGGKWIVDQRVVTVY